MRHFALFGALVIVAAAGLWLIDEFVWPVWRHWNLVIARDAGSGCKALGGLRLGVLRRPAWSYVRFAFALPAEFLFSVRGGFIVGLCFCTKSFRVRFSLIGWLINVLANLGNALVFIRWLYIHNETLAIGRTNKPPTSQSRVGISEH
jgi:hypothetical protein